MKEEEIKRLFIELGIIDKPKRRPKKRKKTNDALKEKVGEILGLIQAKKYEQIGLKRIGQQAKWLLNKEEEEIDDKKPMKYLGQKQRL